MTNLTEFTRALAQFDYQPGASLAALDALVKRVVGARLFTLMTFDATTGEASRAYSDRPEDYPISGRKPANRTDWSRIVLERHETFVANDIDAIARVFPDYKQIQSLGCESCINVPVIVAGNVLGTLNILHEKGYYTPERVAAAETLKLPGAAVFILLENITSKGDPV